MENMEQNIPYIGIISIPQKQKFKIRDTIQRLIKVTFKKTSNTSLKSISISTLKINGKTYKVNEIAANAFKSHKSLTTVTIGSSVTLIGTNAFYGCPKLKTIKGAGGITTIGNGAFSGCKVLTTVPTFASVKKIGDKAFYNCLTLPKFTIGTKVASIGKGAFLKCKKLKAITIKTTKLTDKNVGTAAFKTISPTATIKVPAKMLKKYKSLLKKKGITGKKQKIIK